jgi:hypothetical protein
MISWDELVCCCLLVAVYALHYQPSCQMWLHLTVSFVCVGVKPLLQRWKQKIIAQRRMPLV